MTVDPYNKHSQIYLDLAVHGATNLQFEMQSQQVNESGVPEFGFPQYGANFHGETYRQCQLPNAGEFQFSLPNLSNHSNGFLFSSQLQNSPPILPSNAVVQFPFASDAFSQASYPKSVPHLFSDKLQGGFSESSKFVKDMLRCKRKPECIDLPPTKQHITEEKMAESMSRLHICSETPGTSEPEDRKMQRLYMCDEMRRLQAESIIPHQILSKIARPCTALVPWTPPVLPLPGTSGISNSGGNDSNNNNNSEDEVDNYTSDSDKSTIEIEVEPNPNMDLDL